MSSKFFVKFLLSNSGLELDATQHSLGLLLLPISQEAERENGSSAGTSTLQGFI